LLKSISTVPSKHHTAGVWPFILSANKCNEMLQIINLWVALIGDRWAII
jgi:hypothetical protein